MHNLLFRTARLERSFRITRRARTFAVPVAVLLGCCGLLAAQDEKPKPPASGSRLGALSHWDDGMAEMCYYDAKKTIYGKPRTYTRVHILIREFMDVRTGVKSDDGERSDTLAVFKLNICEEIPTENYNYRLMTSVFLDRRTLRPVKTVSASQEWCGTTFKLLRWTESGLNFKSFSYFGDEADREWRLPASVTPLEAASILAREVVAAGGDTNAVELGEMLAPLRTNHGGAQRHAPATIEVADAAALRVPAGTFEVTPVTIRTSGRDYKYWIETAPPHRLIRYDFGDESGVLRFHERRAYWDRKWASGFHKPEQAP